MMNVLIDSSIRGARRVSGLNPKEQVLLNKTLYQPPRSCFMLLPESLWEKLADRNFYKQFSRSTLRDMCRGRGLETLGNNKELIDRIVEDLLWQQKKEIEMKTVTSEDQEDKLNALGGVWTFGAGYSGQLGHGTSQPLTSPKQIRALRGRSILKVCAGFDSDIAFAISKLGDVYVWGHGSGPTGLREQKEIVPEAHHLPSNTPGDSFDDENEIGRDHIKQSIRVVPARCPSKRDILEPVLLSHLYDEEISDIAVGRTHCAATARSGDIYTWGQNSHGQLGCEPHHQYNSPIYIKESTSSRRDCPEPCLLEVSIPAEEFVSSVCVGTCQTFAVTTRGTVYAWGNASNNIHQCTGLDVGFYFKNKVIKQVSCGATHTALLTDKGEIWTYGSGDGGRLGHGDMGHYSTPRVVEKLRGETVIEVACSVWHSAAVVLVPPLLKAGWVFTWGTGRAGQLGLGGTQLCLSPEPVTDLIENHVLVHHISLGMYHNAALTVDGEVYTWGSNVNGCLGRPHELATTEEDFCAVPGRVEGLAGVYGVGSVCSGQNTNICLKFDTFHQVACGREFTVLVTRPYDGPSKSEVQKLIQAQQEETNALARAAKYQEDLAAELDEAAREDLTSRLLHILAEFPRCAQCTIQSVCPGFQPDLFRPIFCRHCKHLQERHVKQTGLKNSEGLEQLQQLCQRLELLTPSLNEAKEDLLSHNAS